MFETTYISLSLKLRYCLYFFSTEAFRKGMNPTATPSPYHNIRFWLGTKVDR